MNVQPVKKYETPSYPTLTDLKCMDIYKDYRFSTRKKVLITAAAVVLCTSLTGCTPLSGTPPMETPRLDGAPPSTQAASEHDALSTLKNIAMNINSDINELNIAITDGQSTKFILSEYKDFTWNEETDIRIAFSEFLDWMKAEGVI